MRDSSSRLECGYPGISKSTCESRGCCFDNTIQGVKWCFRPGKAYASFIKKYHNNHITFLMAIWIIQAKAKLI